MTPTTKFIATALAVAIAASCHKVEIIRPPEGGAPSGPVSGAGEFKGDLLLGNRVATSNLIPSDADYLVIDEEVGSYFTSSDFGTPGNITKLPYLKSTTIAGFQAQTLPAGFKSVNYPGAFGTEADPEWAINSNWFKLDATQNAYTGQATAEVISGEINSNRTLTADKTYLLRGQVSVNAPAVLTIEPGTVIFGDGKPSDGVLCINRGAKLVAKGTAEKPIVFTSKKTTDRQRGDWGGIVICGKAPNNKGTDVLVEGIEPGTSGQAGKYGGTDAADNSGEISFVRVEFAGIALTPGNELNGITLGSVGTGTKIDHIIISVGGDDGIEWFGGTVQCKFLAFNDILDDDMDIDAGFVGGIQFAYSVRSPYYADGSLTGAMEISSSKTTGTMPRTAPVLANITSVGPIHQVGNVGFDPDHEGGCRVNTDAKPNLYNSIVIGWPRGVMNF